jgi:enoyl-CoA hydratase/carnithine racemase
MTTPMPETLYAPQILSKIHGYAGVITLNRPSALNALSLPMIREMTRLLTEWKDHPRVRTVIVQSADKKAFCAGGDIRSVYEARRKEDWKFLTDIFQEEYLLNFLIRVYPKPYISLIDGIAMGGGLGISVHGSHCLITENAVMAMPETTIGFFPDVGASSFLNQCPGEIGTFLGLLGEKISGEDALYAGLATHRVASSQLNALYKTLIQADAEEAVNEILQDLAWGQEDCFLQTHRELIDRCFSERTVEEILAALRIEKNGIAQTWFKVLSGKSPTSLKLTLALLRRAKGRPLKETLSLDFCLSQHCVKGHDFFEGIRALLIDKDQNPHWQPSQLSDVTPEMIESYFV